MFGTELERKDDEVVFWNTRMGMENVGNRIQTKMVFGLYRQPFAMNLTEATTEELLHEIQRRAFTATKQKHAWVCDECGGSVSGGDDWEGKAFANHGQVWCLKCTDGGRLDLYGERGKKSVPMRHTVPNARGEPGLTEPGKD